MRLVPDLGSICVTETDNRPYNHIDINNQSLLASEIFLHNFDSNCIIRYWPVIDNALRKAAYERGINVRLMGSHWEDTSYDMPDFLKSLGSWNIIGCYNGSIETVRIYIEC